jgi:hypothetical protein
MNKLFWTKISMALVSFSLLLGLVPNVHAESPQAVVYPSVMANSTYEKMPSLLPPTFTLIPIIDTTLAEKKLPLPTVPMKALAVTQAPVQETTPKSMEETLACIRSIEGGYTSVNPSGYYGAYQFAQGTWNSTASGAGRSDLVGVNPATASPADQDEMARQLIARRGLQPWPTPNRVCR